MVGPPVWRASIRPRPYSAVFVLPIVAGVVMQYLLMSPSALGVALRTNGVWGMVPLYAAIVLGVVNVLIPRRVTYALEGDTLIVARWWRRAAYSLVGVSLAYGKQTTAYQGVTGTFLELTTPQGRVGLVGAACRLHDAARYTLPTAARHVPTMAEPAFLELLARLDRLVPRGPAGARGSVVDVTRSGGATALLTFGGTGLAMLVTFVLGSAPRFASPATGYGAAGLTLLLFGWLLLRPLWRAPYRLELVDGTVALRRGSQVVVVATAVGSLQIAHGRYVVGRGGYQMPMVTLRFPAGPTLRIGALGTAAPAHGKGRTSWFVEPRYNVSALEWRVLMRGLGRPDLVPPG